ncbi:hypothetical protein BDV41DRAFT_581586 [Aspergillus transmontanensis]|uniref:Uncharacterized protein n=1 Tax=Aspergillus transmontanensis TaxID=1034304 RepID=A0A5N6VIG6_9EURO|nr:hypothetical protein BDV41DRAFT_581586 [Aspergillus transmontanensis]
MVTAHGQPPNSTNVPGAQQQAPTTIVQQQPGVAAPHGHPVNFVNAMGAPQGPGTMAPMQTGAAVSYGHPVNPIHAMAYQPAFGTMAPPQTGIPVQYQALMQFRPSQGPPLSLEQTFSILARLKKEMLKAHRSLKQENEQLRQGNEQLRQKNEKLGKEIQKI